MIDITRALRDLTALYLVGYLFAEAAMNSLLHGGILGWVCAIAVSYFGYFVAAAIIRDSHR